MEVVRNRAVRVLVVTTAAEALGQSGLRGAVEASRLDVVSDARAAMRRLETERYDTLVCLGDTLSRGSGLRLVGDVACRFPHMHVIALRTREDEPCLHEEVPSRSPLRARGAPRPRR